MSKFKETLRIIEEGLLKPMSIAEQKDMILNLDETQIEYLHRSSKRI